MNLQISSKDQLNTYYFWVKMDYSPCFEHIAIQARDSHSAIRQLPFNATYWDFSNSKTGS